MYQRDIAPDCDAGPIDVAPPDPAEPPSLLDVIVAALRGVELWPSVCYRVETTGPSLRVELRRETDWGDAWEALARTVVRHPGLGTQVLALVGDGPTAIRVGWQDSWQVPAEERQEAAA